MMGLSVPLSTATVNEVLSLLANVTDLGAVRRALTDLANQTDAHNRARDEASAAQQAAKIDRDKADKLIADATARASAIAAHEFDLRQREAILATERAEFSNTKAAHMADLRQRENSLTARHAQLEGARAALRKVL